VPAAMLNGLLPATRRNLMIYGMPAPGAVRQIVLRRRPDLLDGIVVRLYRAP